MTTPEPRVFFIAGWVRAINQANRRGKPSSKAWDKLEAAWKRKRGNEASANKQL